MKIFRTCPDYVDVAFESIDELVVLSNSVETFFELYFKFDQGNILVNFLLGETVLTQKEIFQQFHEVILLILEVNIIEGGQHELIAIGLHRDLVLQSVLLIEVYRSEQIIFLVVSKNM